MNLFALFFLLGVLWPLNFNELALNAVFPLYLLLLFSLLSILWNTGAEHSGVPSSHAKNCRGLKLIAIGLSSGALLCQWVIAKELSHKLPKSLEGQNIVVEGTITGVPELLGYRARFEFLPESARLLSESSATTQVNIRSTFALNKVLISWYSKQVDVRAGQRWQLTVRLKSPRSLMNPGGFDYAGWLFQKRIHAVGYVVKSPGNKVLGSGHAPLGQFRQTLVELLENQSERLQQTGLLQALLVGVRYGVSDTHWDTLRATGTSHLLAISGLHVGLASLWGLLTGALVWRISIWCRFSVRTCRYDFAAPFAVMFAGSYAALAGFTLPTQRAVIMLVVLLLLRSLRVHTHSRIPISAALIVVLLFDPLAPLSPGFWLSFLAVAILLYNAGPGSSGRFSAVRQLASTHGRMALLMFPLTAIFFNQASVVAPLANLIAIPLISLITVPLLLLWLSIYVVFDVSLMALLTLADYSLSVLLTLLNFLSTFRFASLTLVQVAWWQISALILGLLILCKPGFGVSRCYAGALLLPWVVAQLNPPPVEGLRVTVLDVGQGLSVVVRTATKTLVYDVGGRISRRTSMAEAVVLPYLRSQGIRQVDQLMLSHFDSDHAAGASRFVSEARVNQVLGPKPEYPVMELCMNAKPWVWDDVHFQVIHPSITDQLEGNDASCSLLIQYAGSTVLLPGDIEAAGESQIVARMGQGQGILPVDLVVAPHHGSKTSSNLPFLDTFQPRAVVYSVGYRNRFGFPHETVQMRYKILGSCQYRTDLDGALTFNFGAKGLVSEPDRYRQSVDQPWNSASGGQSIVQECDPDFVEIGGQGGCRYGSPDECLAAVQSVAKQSMANDDQEVDWP